MKQHPFEAEVRQLAEHYSALVQEHGEAPEGAQWADAATQERRFQVLTQVGALASAKVLDVGCNTGALLGYLRTNIGFTGEYVGCDVAPVAIETARKRFPDARFELRDILSEAPAEQFDYVLISGLFNNLVGDNPAFLKAVLTRAFPLARRGLAFNALSSYVDYAAPGLAYYSPDRVFRFCKERLSPLVTLRHDYYVRDAVVPYEFAVFVYPCPVATRANRACEAFFIGSAI